ACGENLTARQCGGDNECLSGGVMGRCLPSASGSGNKWCAFSTNTCTAGFRWGVLAGDDLAGQCVPDGPVPAGAMPDSTSAAPRCGNGIKEAGEACDDANNTDGDGCNHDCTSNESCGNGIVDRDVGELCDPPEVGVCEGNCRFLPRCGDEVINPYEQCD